MPITSSVIVAQSVNPDGSISVHERHTDNQGKTYDIDYAAPAGSDINLTLSLRAQNLSAQVDQRQQSESLASNFAVPISKLQFRNLFTLAERIAIDAFNVSFESNTSLTADQKASIRTNLEDYKVAENVILSDPATVAGVQMYETLGLIATGRAAQILASTV